MKKILSMLLIFSSLSFAQKIDLSTLSGDKGLACEALLCLSSGTRPSECKRSIKRFFSIWHHKWWKTLRDRKAFLGLCPVGGGNFNGFSLGNDDKEFKKLKNIIVNLKEDCSIKNLNRVETKTVKAWTKNVYNDDYGYNYITHFRINPKLTESCKALMSSKYTYIKPKYICNKKWYQGYIADSQFSSANKTPMIYGDWGRGYTTTKENCISYKAFQKLPREQKKKYTQFGSTDSSFKYYSTFCIVKKHYIKKDCWVFEN